MTNQYDTLSASRAASFSARDGLVSGTDALCRNLKLPGGCQLLDLPEVVDERGALCFAEGGRHFPFGIERIFWIYDVPEGKTRGGHCHRTCHEVVVPVKGGFTMCVDDGRERIGVRMDSPRVGIFIPAGLWCSLVDFEPDTVCVVAASQAYDASGYINSYEEYKASLK